MAAAFAERKPPRCSEVPPVRFVYAPFSCTRKQLFLLALLTLTHDVYLSLSFSPCLSFFFFLVFFFILFFFVRNVVVDAGVCARVAQRNAIRGFLSAYIYALFSVSEFPCSTLGAVQGPFSQKHLTLELFVRDTFSQSGR